MGKLPLKLLKSTPTNGVEKASCHPLYGVLKYRPNPYMTASHFWSSVEFNRNHYGNAYCLIVGAGSGTQLHILPSDCVEMWCDDIAVWGEEFAVWYIYTSPQTGRRYRFCHEEILHFKNSTSDSGLIGVSVRDKLQDSIAAAQKSQKLLSELYDNNFTARAVAKYSADLNDKYRDKLMMDIERFATGKKSVRTIVPLPNFVELDALKGSSLADNQFLELRKYSALQIAAAFGIKPNQLNDYEKSSYSSAEAQQLSFYVDTLLYIIKQYEEELTYKLLSADEVAQGLHFKFNVSVILRADSKTQIESLAQAVSNGIYTLNEARALLDLQSKEGGDRLTLNGNAIPAELAGIQYTAKENAQTADVKLNGAQITALMTIIQNVAAGVLSRQAAIEIVVSTLGISHADAQRMIEQPQKKAGEDI